ncbi:hypothetical protein F2Q69_00019733 [Brassica cretica]|uniref:Uncharacterized protein n=1 Tax=Brassica cretica TaxID=69181 RepID=A0A8S9QJJ2_BRACR|nr:hypothetical protein F2Q69_00019733 [Brassica cretica]
MFCRQESRPDAGLRREGATAGDLRGERLTAAVCRQIRQAFHRPSPREETGRGVMSTKQPEHFAGLRRRRIQVTTMCRQINQGVSRAVITGCAGRGR